MLKNFRNLKDGILYEYRIQALSGKRESKLSAPLFYQTNHGYCGDGNIESSFGEECDDGNVRNGDGCNIQCQIEKVFNCTLEPSLCYRHDRDG